MTLVLTNEDVAQVLTMKDTITALELIHGIHGLKACLIASYLRSRPDWKSVSLAPGARAPVGSSANDRPLRNRLFPAGAPNIPTPAISFVA
jgi:hypothetical protein